MALQVDVTAEAASTAAVDTKASDEGPVAKATAVTLPPVLAEVDSVAALVVAASAVALRGLWLVIVGSVDKPP